MNYRKVNYTEINIIKEVKLLVIKSFVFNLFSENTYVVWDEGSGESTIIDPGCSNDREEKILENYIDANNLKVKYLINTHCHIDHIIGCAFVKGKFNPAYFIPEKDLFLMEGAEQQANAFNLTLNPLPEPDEYLTEDLHLNLGKSKMSFLFTPGHTPGEFCVNFPAQAFCITGDVLFKNSIGRTDLWGGDYEMLLDSIKTKLLTLPDNVLIYPGHGESSKIELEKRDNPFIKEIR